jgi:citrate synthase
MGGPLVELAVEVEDVILAALDRHRPGRDLRTNVEYYASVVLHLVGLPADLFTPTFAVSRMIGWTAHAIEQTVGNRIFRPSSRYVGPTPG